MFEIIKAYFLMGLFSEADLDIFVLSGDISAEQKDTILNLEK